jgi:rubrerythrin
MTSTYELFQMAERLEDLSAKLYLVLAERFERVPSARDLFRRLSAEEVQHAARVRLLAAHYRNDPRMFDSGELRSQTSDFSVLLAEATDAIEAVTRGDWGDDLDGILDRLALVEERCAAFHAKVLARAAAPKVAAFFQELGQQDHEHQRLLAALRPRGVHR